MIRPYPAIRSDEASVRLPFSLGAFRRVHPFGKIKRVIAKEQILRALRTLLPSLIAISLTTAAHAQGTMDFSGAQTLMSTFKTFAMYAGAVICLGGLIFAGIRMMVCPACFVPVLRACSRFSY